MNWTWKLATDAHGSQLRSYFSDTTRAECHSAFQPTHGLFLLDKTMKKGKTKLLIRSPSR